MSDEKLEFSMQDLGRLAHFMSAKDARPLDLVFEWVRLHTHTPDERRRVFDELNDGYFEEIGDGNG